MWEDTLGVLTKHLQRQWVYMIFRGNFDTVDSNNKGEGSDHHGRLWLKQPWRKRSSIEMHYMGKKTCLQGCKRTKGIYTIKTSGDWLVLGIRLSGYSAIVISGCKENPCTVISFVYNLILLLGFIFYDTHTHTVFHVAAVSHTLYTGS